MIAATSANEGPVIRLLHEQIGVAPRLCSEDALPDPAWSPAEPDRGQPRNRLLRPRRRMRLSAVSRGGRRPGDGPRGYGAGVISQPGRHELGRAAARRAPAGEDPGDHGWDTQ